MYSTTNNKAKIKVTRSKEEPHSNS